MTRSISIDSIDSPEPASLGPVDDGQVLGPILGIVRRRGEEALRLLLEAHRYARELERRVWDFALEIDTLRGVGCTFSELRWLVCKGYVAHASEITMPGELSRTFRRARSASLTFRRKTCFVLTEAGVAFAAGLVDGAPPFSRTRPTGLHADDARPSADSAPPRPKWDRDRQELRLGRVVIKQYKVPAANQERVLAAFEEEGWPIHIDDPLPPAGEQDPKRRLHDTINSLNRNQKHGLLRFLGDGSGQGIRWKLASENGNGKSASGRLA